MQRSTSEHQQLSLISRGISLLAYVLLLAMATVSAPQAVGAVCRQVAG